MSVRKSKRGYNKRPSGLTKKTKTKRKNITRGKNNGKGGIKNKRNKNKNKRKRVGKGKEKKGSKGKGKGKSGGKRKRIGKKNTKNKSQKKKTKQTSDERRSLTDAETRDYRWAMNQRRKALRVQGWFRLLEKKVNNSRTFFLEGAEFFKDCPEALSLYEKLR